MADNNEVVVACCAMLLLCCNLQISENLHIHYFGSLEALNIKKSLIITGKTKQN